MFSTKERDESTGLDNFGFRYYDSELGRFITRDPSGYPDGANNDTYCANNPVNHIDPLGLSWGEYWSDVGEVFKGYGDAVVGTVKGVTAMVSSPVQTVKGIASAIANPSATINAIKNDIVNKSGTLRGQGSLVGDVLLGVATGGVIKAASKTAMVVKMANKAAKITDKIAKGAKVVGGKAGSKIIEKSAQASAKAKQMASKAKQAVKDKVAKVKNGSNSKPKPTYDNHGGGYDGSNRMVDQDYNPNSYPDPDGGFSADLSKSKAKSHSGQTNAANKQINDKMNNDSTFRQKMEAKHGSDVVDRTSTSGSGRRNPADTEWDHSSTDPNSMDLRTKANHALKTKAEGQDGGGWKKFHGNGKR